MIYMRIVCLRVRDAFRDEKFANNPLQKAKSKKRKVEIMNNILKLKSIFIFSVFLLFACGAQFDEQESIEAARKYIEANQLRAANLELKNTLQGNPKNAEARYLLGQLNLTIGDMAFAEKEFRKAEESGWDEGPARIGASRSLINSRQFQKVLDNIEIKDSYGKSVQADLYGLRAFAEAALGYAGLAKASIQKGKEIDADAFHVLKTEIQLEISQANTELAAAQLQKALSLYENNAELLLLHAVNSLQNKKSEVAKSDFLNIISQEPKNLVTYNGRSARIGLARLEIVSKEFAKANETLAPLFKQSPNDAEVNYLGAMLDYETKNYQRAEERSLKVLKLAPEHAPTQLLSGSVNFARKKYQQAAYYLGKYLQQEPNNLNARKLLGRTYMLLDQHSDAQLTLTPGLKGRENDAELLTLVSLSQLQTGDVATGIDGLKKALQVAPEDKALKNELAKAYISAGETEKAIKQLNATIAEGGNKNQAEALIISAYLRSKQYDEAINTALNILSRSPKDVAVLSLVGNVFAASGDRAEARKYFNKALEIEPNNSLATMLLAALEEVDGNTAEAERLYKSLIKDDATSINPLLALARLSEQKKDYAGMVKWLEKANENAPMELRPKTVLAEYYLRENQLDKVETLLKAAIAISANDPGVLFIKGKMLMTQNRYNEAVSPLTELVTRTPESVLARSMLGETYLKLNQPDDARRQLKLALEQKPYYVPALLVLARVEQVTGKYPQGLAYVEKVIKAQPDLYLAYDLGGDISMSTKNYGAANDYYQKVMSIKPNSVTAIKSAEVYSQLAQHEQAISMLKQWLSKNPEDTGVRQFLGNAYLGNGDNKEAIQAFEIVYIEQPENIVALNNLAWLYSLEKDRRALEFAEKAYNIKPEDAGIQDTYGWILVQQGKVEEGLRILQKVMKSLPDVPDVRYHYATALMKSGEEIKARKIFAGLLENDEPFEGREQVVELMK